jgi:hypothetical protein
MSQTSPNIPTRNRARCHCYTSRGTRPTGQLFFASTNELVHQFDLRAPEREVVIDLTEASVWDSSAVATLDTVVAVPAPGGAEITGPVTGPRTHPSSSNRLSRDHGFGRWPVRRLL